MQVSDSQLRTKRYVVHALHLHLVFVSKYRKKVFIEKQHKTLYNYFEQNIRHQLLCAYIPSLKRTGFTHKNDKNSENH